MAINSTIYKAELHIANIDTHYYQQHQLTIAKHPSETDERLMIRLLAFVLFANEQLEFGKGIGSEEEAALWQKNLSGEIELWIEVGLPNDRRLRKALGKAKQVVVLSYGRRSTVDQWWQENIALAKKSNLKIIYLPSEATEALAKMATRNMQLTSSIESGQVSLSSNTSTISIDPVIIHAL